MTVELDGEPLLATAATVLVTCETLDGSDPEAIIEQAKRTCMVANSLAKGVPVTIRTTS